LTEHGYALLRNFLLMEGGLRATAAS